MACSLSAGGYPEKAARPAAEKPARLAYPAARQSDQVDDYHGVRVPDPYRWLEDPRRPETRAWIGGEVKLTNSYLERIPQRGAIKERLTRLWNYERCGDPERHGERYFYQRNNGLQQQSVLYTAKSLATDAKDAELRVLLDPNTLSKEGTISLAGTAVSDDGKYLAYGLSQGGSDWREWRVRDVATGRDTNADDKKIDHLRWIKFSDISWLPSGGGFYYSRYAEPREESKLEDQVKFQKVYFHRLGTPQSEDKLVYERKDQGRWIFDGHVTDDGKYLIITIRNGTERNNAVFCQRLEGRRKDSPPTDRSPVVELLKDFDARYVFIGNEGSRFWFFTDQGATRGRLVAIDIEHPERTAWQELIPENESTLLSVHLVGERFIAVYLKDAQSLVRVHDLTGKHLRDVDLPDIGTATGFEGKRTDGETFYTFSSFTTPATVYRYDIAAGKSTVFRQPKVDFKSGDYVTRQVFYRSKDGTKIPMFISHRRDVQPTSDTPCLLYGYGGFNISITPQFSVANLVWMELGGVFAVANLRGGGEYGRAWHNAGKLDKKQNVFDDFIAAAEWLIDNRQTSRKKLAITGRSNGGLLVGACMTQRPDLFGACIPGVGVMDMLRFHRFTIGWAWVSDYGSADANLAEFKTLRAYSPLHNLKRGVEYPPTLIITADHDDRVVPAHSYKFAATLQAHQAGDAPVLIRIETSAGHGAGTPTGKRIEESADVLAFLAKELGVAKAPK